MRTFTSARSDIRTTTRRTVVGCAAVAGLVSAVLASCGSPSLESQCADLDVQANEAAARYDAATTEEEVETTKAEWNELVYQLIELDC